MPQPLLLLAFIAFAVSDVGSQLMPQFVFSPTTKLLYSWGHTWQAGCPDSIGVLRTGRTLTVRIHVAGDFHRSFKKFLAYHCESTSYVDTLLPLESLNYTTPTTQYCGHMAFTMRKKPVFSDPDPWDDFELAMSQSNVPPSDVFTRRLKLRILIQYSNTSLLSNHLYLWNLDPISNFVATPAPSKPYQLRSFITDEGINFLNGRVPGTNTPSNIPFIESRMLDIVNSAPKIFQSKVKLGARINFDYSGCFRHIRFHKTAFFGNYDSWLVADNARLQRAMRFVLATGQLWFFGCPLKNEILALYKEQRPPYTSICLSVSFSGDHGPYYRLSEIYNYYIKSAGMPYSGCSQAVQRVCHIAPGVSPFVTIFSGTESTPLTCPIFCSDIMEQFSFYFNDVQLKVPLTRLWSFYPNNSDEGIRIFKDGNLIELPPFAAPFSGLYRCVAGDKEFTFNVTVVSVPSFHWPTAHDQSASNITYPYPPPLKVFVIEDERVTFGCSVTYSGLNSVTLEAIVQIPNESSSVSDSRLHAEAIRLIPSESLSSIMNGRAITAVLSNVFKNAVTFRFVCRTSVTSALELSTIGLPSYSSESGTNVFFVPRPRRNSFLLDKDISCPEQRCDLGNGVTFSFSLSVDYAGRLARMGVEVVSFLRLGHVLLTNVSMLMRPEVSELLPGDASLSGIVYRIRPVMINSTVHEELQKHGNLTAVFNMRYQTGAAVAEDLLSFKSSYGQPIEALGRFDCRADPLCFYSTDFDVDSRLDFLSVLLAVNEYPLTAIGVVSNSTEAEFNSTTAADFPENRAIVELSKYAIISATICIILMSAV